MQPEPRQRRQFFSPSGSLTINDGPPATGRDAITAAAQSFMTAFPDLEVIMDDLSVTSGVSATYNWTLLGTNTGPNGTGNRVHITGYEQWQFNPDSLIATSLGHFDAAQYQHQLVHGTASGITS